MKESMGGAGRREDKCAPPDPRRRGFVALTRLYRGVGGKRGVFELICTAYPNPGVAFALLSTTDSIDATGYEQ